MSEIKFLKVLSKSDRSYGNVAHGDLANVREKTHLYYNFQNLKLKYKENVVFCIKASIRYNILR